MGEGWSSKLTTKPMWFAFDIRVAKHQFSWQFNYMTITHAKRG
jgi:hypothetical protein